jgi:hypothetical protein
MVTAITTSLGADPYPLYLMHVVTAYATAFILLRLSAPLVLAWSAGPLAALISATLVAHWFEPRARDLTGAATDFVVRRAVAPKVVKIPNL